MLYMYVHIYVRLGRENCKVKVVGEEDEREDTVHVCH